MNRDFFKGVFTGILGMVIVFSAFTIIYTASMGETPFPAIMEKDRYVDSKTADEAVFQKKDENVPASEVLRKMTLLQKYIDKYYINDTSGTDYVSGMYKGMIDSLGDIYSAYYSEDEYARLQETSSGNYSGIGAVVQQEKESGNMSIVSVYEDSPAKEAGLRPDDIIYMVDGKSVSGKDLSTVVSWMKGEEGTKVELTVYRKNKKVTLEIERRKIEIKTVASEMLEGDIGYIVVAEFEEATVKQFNHAVDELDKKGMKGLIVDLRNNGGGVMKSAILMLDRLLPEGVVVSTKDKEGTKQVFHSSDQKSFKKPLVVLINENSASASEIFAGAVKDRNAGTLVGMKSFGKGIVQTVFGLGDGSALKLTTSEYFTPSGQNIHGKGIEPDVVIDFPEKVKEKGYVSREEDVQLKRAMEEILRHPY